MKDCKPPALREMLKTRYENYLYDIKEKKIPSQGQPSIFYKKRFDYKINDIQEMPEKTLIAFVEEEMITDFYNTYQKFNQKYSSSPMPSSSNAAEDLTEGEAKGGNADQRSKKEKEEWTKVLMDAMQLYYEKKEKSRWEKLFDWKKSKGLFGGKI